MKIVSIAEADSFIDSLKKRTKDVQKEVILSVDKILEDVKNKGDEALIEYTKKFDGVDIYSDKLQVSAEEIKNAYKTAGSEFIKAITHAKDNIWKFHEKQKSNSWIMTEKGGIILGQKIMPLQNVGIYVPGGTAAYPSSVLMNAVPARVAGVENIIMATPPQKDGSINPYILVAADIAGVDRIYRIGGAQAIGALAFGTETVPKVDKITGPGNIFVAMAKREVFGYVDIDMVAGPSEILVLADDFADAKYIAADLMSQAEHDVLSSAILVTSSKCLAELVPKELDRQIESMKRKNIIKSSLDNYGAIIVVNNMTEAEDIVNKIAPEHLEIMTKEPFAILDSIKNAGSIFLGKYSPEPVGDYMAGPNHVLPTGGTSRFFSPLSVDDFIKKSGMIYYNLPALSAVKDEIIKLAEVEGLYAHGNSIKVRFEK
jgi:histidinol dehydrogenase